MKQLEISTDTKISIPSTDDNSDIVKIVGTKEGIDRAKHEIQLISDEQVMNNFLKITSSAGYRAPQLQFFESRIHPFVTCRFFIVIGSIETLFF